MSNLDFLSLTLQKEIKRLREIDDFRSLSKSEQSFIQARSAYFQKKYMEAFEASLEEEVKEKTTELKDSLKESSKEVSKKPLTKTKSNTSKK